MRILYISSSYPPHVSGPVTFLLHLLAAMQAKGHQVGVVVPAFGHPPNQRLHQGVMEYHLPSIRNPFRAKHYGFFAPPRAALKAIADFKPEIIHCNDVLLWPELVAKYARKEGVKLVLTQHATTEIVTSRFPDWSQRVTQKVVNHWLRAAVNLFDVVTVPSKTTLDWLQLLKTERPELKIISNGVDVETFQPVSAVSRQTRKLSRAIYVGRLDTEKALEVLIKALPLTKQRFEVWLVGTGLEEKRLRRLAEKNKLMGWVKFFGQVPPEKVVELSQQADVFVMPSAIETQSIAALEAAACGLPLVLAKAAALPELVKPGVNGYLFKPGDSADLAKKLDQVFDASVAERTKLGRASRAMALKHRWSAVADQWDKLYRQLVKSEKTAAA